ncbi:unnamed protein product [Paramecium sonneborni]|uniref:Group 1 truncated hemoglobin n=1 Tax=Paramecium sonneborni TaxID=65129 RepID=A0A8S1P692_9CILI|nr:unnamed protein product [Paramecium sonneborni]
MTLFEQLGGEAAVTAVTTQFYANIQADATVANFFNGINMADQTSKTASFLCAALGGPKAWGGRNLKEVHANMGVTDAQFTTVIGHLRSALTSAGVAADLVDQTVAVAETVRGDVVTA